jgi:Domain of unknown function (DUF3387)
VPDPGFATRPGAAAALDEALDVREGRSRDDYNAGSLNVETYFNELVEFSHALDQEEARALSQGLSEEQQAIFDILTRPDPGLSAEEERQVKRVAEELLTILKRDKLVLDWRKEQQTRAAVRLAVEETLDRLPEKYTRQIYTRKCDAVYEHVFDSYWDDGHSVYDRGIGYRSYNRDRPHRSLEREHDEPKQPSPASTRPAPRRTRKPLHPAARTHYIRVGLRGPWSRAGMG